MGSMNEDFLKDMDTLGVFDNVGKDKRTLHLIDLSPIFYWTMQGLNDCFSMSYLQQVIYQIAKFTSETDDIVICADNTPVKKYQSIEGSEQVYKKNRVSLEPWLKRHRALLNFGTQIMCDELGITYQSIEGYEADDMIYNTIAKYRNMYDKIIIHSADSDMLFMIDNVVSVDRGRYGYITMQNYSSIFSDFNLMYNTAIFYCICKKNKDNRGMLGSRMLQPILDNIKGIDPYKFCNVEDTISIADGIFKKIAEETKNLSDRYRLDYEHAMRVLKMALPLSIIGTNDEVELLSPSKCNLSKLNQYYKVMCKRDYTSEVFCDVYERLINFYGGI